MSDTISVRVVVEDAWDEVTLRLEESTPIRDLKRLALEAAGVTRPADGYLVKFRGAEQESEATLADVGVVPNAGLVVVGRRRRPVF